MTVVVTEPGELAELDLPRPLGLVPTMGALHAGHDALVARARAECASVIASVFVNPAQFGDAADLAAYPRTLDADVARLAALGVDAVLAPTPERVYPAGHVTVVDLTGPPAAGGEADHRPGHFRGVATIVAKLLLWTRPDRAYFGQKDAQQVAVVRRLIADLELGADVVAVPTVRDADGLALSSRNARLDGDGRRAALALPRGLAAATAAWHAGERDPRALEAAAAAVIAAEPRLDPGYVACVDAATFAPANADLPAPAVLCVAATVRRTGGAGPVRLIDNVLLPPALDPGDLP